MQRRMVVALLGALSGFLYVAIGAFGAHGISDPHARELIETGVRYHGVHAMALFLIVTMDGWGAPRAYAAAPFFVAGVVLFCGGIYALAFGAPSALAIIIPFGGLSFLVGWILIGRAALQLSAKSAKA